jgi:hypothetical protein
LGSPVPLCFEDSCRQLSVVGCRKAVGRSFLVREPQIAPLGVNSSVGKTNWLSVAGRSRKAVVSCRLSKDTRQL